MFNNLKEKGHADEHAEKPPGAILLESKVPHDRPVGKPRTTDGTS